MRHRAIHAAVVAAVTVAGGWSTDAFAAGNSPTTAHVTLQTKVGGYSADVTVTRPATGKTTALTVHLSRGNPSRDQQTHDYAFTLPRGAVTIDSKLGKARIKAKLGSFGSVDLKLTGRGKTATEPPPARCKGPATLSRAAGARGKIKIQLGGLGTLSRAGKTIRLDRAKKRGTITCPGKCRRFAGTQIAGVNVGNGYLSVQSDGFDHTYVFATVSEAPASPAVSINHTRFALGGSIVTSPGAGPDDLSIELTGGGPATGDLRFSGTGAPQPDAGCAGHTVRRVFGPVTGQLALPIDGVGSVGVSGDGSATAPVAAYREQVD